jgi:hypothetical protein
MRSCRKDKTQLETLDGVKNIESIVRRIEDRLDSILSQAASSAAPETLPSTSVDEPFPPSLGSVYESILEQQPETSTKVNTSSYGSISAAAEVLGWPAVRRSCQSITDFPADSASVLLERQDALPPLSSHSDVAIFDFSTPSEVALSKQPATIGSNSSHLTNFAPFITAYFDGFNSCSPILDRHSFQNDVFGRAIAAGFDDSAETVLVYLVLALGEMVILGTQGVPPPLHDTRQIGVRGATAAEPPGLGYFNEARRRMGFHLTGRSLICAQALVLAG